MKKDGKKITIRKVGERVFEGTMIKDAKGMYIYDYPECRKVNALLTNGDQIKIATDCKVCTQYVRSVLRGIRWNTKIVETAIRYGEDNLAKGYVSIKN